jgi:microsomal dipeptidase-like Zn-dependent dipeptidase
MIADLHCHYPMHVLAQDASPSETYDRLMRVRHRRHVLDRVRALVLRIAARGFNYRDHAGEWRVSLDGLEAAQTRLVLSVLFNPFAEVHLDEPRPTDPAGYFTDLMTHLTDVEAELERLDPRHERHVIARSAADLDAAQAGGRIAFVHCIEGGFQLGRTPAAIIENVAEFARRGGGYVTLAHLFYRGVATNAPALPFIPDALYDRLFCQPRHGLSELGQAAVRAMYEQRVLIDLSHMRPNAVQETLALLRELDREHGAEPEEYPVIASHAGYRFGRQTYMLTVQTIREIARRNGVVGLMMARHQLQDGRSDGEGIDHTVATIAAHIDAIAGVTGSHAHVGIGSDLDGFVKPTMSAIEVAADLGRLERPLRDRYPADADAILTQNALRVVRTVLAQRPVAAPAA